MSAEIQTYRVETTVGRDGVLTLEHLPFSVGQPVEVTIRPLTPIPQTDDPHPLRGTVLRYDRPFDPVAEDDWEALQ